MAEQDIEDGTPDWYDHLQNAPVLHESLALAPAESARLAREAATAIDAAIANLDAEAIDRLAAEDSWLLRRHRHRSEHLDEIERAVRAKSA